MLDDVVGSFLDGLSERELDAPFQALLRAHSFTDVTLLHGAYEFGKDVIAKDADRRTQYGFQSKAGDIGLGAWGALQPQLTLLRTAEIAHPSFDRSLPRTGVLVLSGRLTGAAAPAAEDYARHVRERGEPGFVVWDRGKLTEMFLAALHAGLAGVPRPGFLELVGRIDDGRVTDGEIERYSAAWITEGPAVEWRSVLEAAVLANRLRLADRLDLACFTALALLRGVWATAHGSDPPPAAALKQASLARRMFQYYAGDVWAGCTDDLLDPRYLVGVGLEESGIFSHYPVRCSRLLEILGLYGLSLSDENRDRVGVWLARFIEAQPGAAHPISDRWATSLVPSLILLEVAGWDGADSFLRAILRWVGDRYDDDGSGLAPAEASPEDEVAYLLGNALEDLAREPTSGSYLATVLLDMASILELHETYELAYNDLHAVQASPTVVLPRDDGDQYVVSGDVNIPTVTNPRYREAWSLGDGWRMAPHHHGAVDDFYLARIGRHWDQLAISVVLRDRHSAVGVRTLVESRGVTSFE